MSANFRHKIKSWNTLYPQKFSLPIKGLVNTTTLDIWKTEMQIQSCEIKMPQKCNVLQYVAVYEHRTISFIIVFDIYCTRNKFQIFDTILMLFVLLEGHLIAFKDLALAVHSGRSGIHLGLQHKASSWTKTIIAECEIMYQYILVLRCPFFICLSTLFIGSWDKVWKAIGEGRHLQLRRICIASEQLLTDSIVFWDSCVYCMPCDVSWINSFSNLRFCRWHLTVHQTNGLLD